MGETTVHHASFMWPDNEAEVDLLQFSHLASSVTHLVRQPHLLPTTIGIFGDWGSGKSTLLRLVRKDLEKDPKCLCIQFNAWLFEGYEDAKTALMGTILDAIEERITSDQNLLERFGDKVKGLLKRVRWLRLGALSLKVGIPAVVGVPALTFAAAASALGDVALDGMKDADLDKAKLLMKDDEQGDEVRHSVTKFRVEFEKLLADCEVAAVVVFVDDLDRCLPATTIGILEAIKLFLFVPRSAFILAADERLVQQAVRLHHPAATQPETDLGRDYLEKLVQIPVRIPRPSGDGIESYISLLFAQRHFPPDLLERVAAALAGHPNSPGSVGDDLVEVPGLGVRVPAVYVSQELREDLAVAATIGRVLRVDIEGSPRRIKRFLNTLFLRLQIAEGRHLALKKHVLAKLMLLEYLHAREFLQLAFLQASQAGHPRELAQAETAVSPIVMGAAAEAGMPWAAAAGAEKRKASRPDTKARTQESVPDDSTAGVSAEVSSWLTDSWMRRWLLLEPPLGSEDLGPYFTIAHDRVGHVLTPIDEMSQRAREVFDMLLDPAKEASVKLGLSQAASLVAGDLADVFERLSSRSRVVEDRNNRLLTEVIVRLADKRPELGAQIVALVAALPDARVPLAAPIVLVDVLAAGPHRDTMQKVVARWATSADNRLRKASEVALNRLGLAPDPS